MTKYIRRTGANNTFMPNDLLAYTITTDTGCMEWQRRRGPSGYGEVGYFGKKLRTHRLMALLVYGEPRDGDFALHSCDNPPCINPEHLRWGSALDNSADAKARGRTCRGDKQGLAKLTWDQVQQIRNMDFGSRTYAEIGSLFNVSASSIWRVLHSYSWQEDSMSDI